MGKEGKRIRKSQFIEPVRERRAEQAGDDTTEDTHLHGWDAQHGGVGTILDVVCYLQCSVDFHEVSGDLREDADGRQHDQVEESRRQDRNGFFFLGHAHADGEGKDECQVSEHNVTGTGKHFHQTIQERTRVECTLQPVCGDGRGVCKGTAYAEQDTGER